jgi:acetolactate synthase I/II/III large subunit
VNGAERLIRTAHAAGLKVCFANPGTTEMHLVAALDAVGGMRTVLGLFEGVCTGAADGYARMAGMPALTLLHLGPGLGNGLANLHNARRARSPIVNLVGDHAGWHLAADTPLTSDIAALARTVGWVGTARRTDELDADLIATVEAALGPPRGVATLIVPHDLTWEAASNEPIDSQLRPMAASRVQSAAIETAAAALRHAKASTLFLGGTALSTRGLRAAARVAGATGCGILHETLPARIERGAGIPIVKRLPYFPELARESLGATRHLVLAGTVEPLAFFGYPGGASRLIPEDCGAVTLAAPDEDVEYALDALAEAVGASLETCIAPSGSAPPPPTGALTPDTLCQAIAAVQPAGAIVVDESATSGFRYFAYGATAPPHTVMTVTGGAIGQGLPCAVGAAIACPDHRVIAFEADGSGMYTVQSLWTMARESLDVTIVVCANRAYRVLQMELARSGVVEPGPRARRLTDLSGLDWVSIAKGMGMPASRVATADDLVAALRRTLNEPGPSLIEAVL